MSPHSPLLALLLLVVPRAAGQDLRYELHGAAADSRFAWSVATGVDADGVPDVLSKAASSSGGAPLRLVSGVDGHVLVQIPAEHGASLSATGDVDTDGYADFAVGLPQNARVRVYSGKTHASIVVIAGASGSVLGNDVAHGGDWDGDGVDDLVVGVPGEHAIVVYSLPSQIELHRIVRSQINLFGSQVADTADLDGDGLSELLAPLPFESRLMVFDGTCVNGYGQPCPGGLGTAPTIELVPSCPQAGTLLVVDVGAAPPGGVAFLLAGLQQAQTPLPFGCTLLVSNGSAPPFVCVAPVAAFGEPAGHAYFGIPVPQAAQGLAVAFQAFVSDASQTLAAASGGRRPIFK